MGDGTLCVVAVGCTVIRWTVNRARDGSFRYRIVQEWRYEWCYALYSNLWSDLCVDNFMVLLG